MRKLKMIPPDVQDLTVSMGDDCNLEFDEYTTKMVQNRFPVAGIVQMDAELTLFVDKDYLNQKEAL